MPVATLPMSTNHQFGAMSSPPPASLKAQNRSAAQLSQQSQITRQPSANGMQQASLVSSQSVAIKNAPQTTEEVSAGVLMYIGSLIKNLTTSETTPPPQPDKSNDLDWQAKYLSPVHTKLKREGRANPDQRDLEYQLRAKFNGVLPFFRVWELKMEEMDAEPPTMGRGTPSRPNKQVFAREMAATKLFLRDYSMRRGLRTQKPSTVSEQEVDIRTLRKPKPTATQVTTVDPQAAAKAKITHTKTQSIAPSKVRERRHSTNARQPSKLMS